MGNRRITMAHIAVAIALLLAAPARAQGGAAPPTPPLIPALDGLAKEWTANNGLLGRMRGEEKKLSEQEPRLQAESKRIASEVKTLTARRTEIQLEQSSLDSGLKKTYFDQGCRPNQASTDLALVERCNRLVEQVNTRQIAINTKQQDQLAREAKLQASAETEHGFAALVRGDEENPREDRGAGGPARRAEGQIRCLSARHSNRQDRGHKAQLRQRAVRWRPRESAALRDARMPTI